MDCEIGIIYFIRLIYFYSASICDSRDGVYKQEGLLQINAAWKMGER